MNKSSFAGRFKVGTRILVGYGLVLAFLVLVALLGYLTLGQIRDDVREFDRITDNAIRIVTVDRNMTWLRRNVLAFTGGNPDTQALARVREVTDPLRKDLGLAVASARNSERKEKLAATAELFERYVANFEKVVTMRERLTRQIDEAMAPLGVGIGKIMSGIVDTAYANEKFENAALAGKAQEAMLMARLSAAKFLTHADPKLAEDAHRWARDFRDRVSVLVARLTIPANIEACNKAAADGSAYIAAFDEVVKLTVEIDRIVNGENRDIANSMATNITWVVNSQRASAEKIGEETKASISSQRGSSTTLSVIAVILGLGFAMVVARSIIDPIRAMTSAMARLAHGDHQVAIPALTNRDEIGEMAQAVQVFKNNAIENERMKEAKEAEDKAKQRRQQESEELIDMFGSSVSGVFHSLSQASDGMAETATSMRGVVEQTNTQIDAVAREVSEAGANAQAVAAASQELTAAIGEISRLVNTSSQVAEEGSSQAETVLRQVTALRDASEKIGDIVGIISNIASQTNLLALNATIEAARAGDAGKGFAVVAGEVKNLSGQTQKATVEIGAQINEIQSSINGTVDAVRAIGQTVTQIYQSSTEIAAAITEQQSATDEIARNIQFVSSSTERIASSMEAVRESADQTNSASCRVHDASSSMAGQTEKLSVEVRDFLGAVKGAGTRHQFERLEVDAPATAEVGGQRHPSHARQLSIAGAWLDTRIDQPPGTPIEVTIQGIARPIQARIAGHADKGTRIQFPMDAGHLAFMTDALARLGGHVKAATAA